MQLFFTLMATTGMALSCPVLCWLPLASYLFVTMLDSRIEADRRSAEAMRAKEVEHTARMLANLQKQ